MENLNIFGEKLKSCSLKPLTGYFRDGCCNTDKSDYGMHTVCAIVTAEFLEFSKASGNDLSTARREHRFEGLKPGDRWCLCAPRWMEAFQAGMAPLIDLEATNEKTLEIIPMDLLLKFAWRTEMNKS